MHNAPKTERSAKIQMTKLGKKVDELYKQRNDWMNNHGYPDRERRWEYVRIAEEDIERVILQMKRLKEYAATQGWYVSNMYIEPEQVDLLYR